MVAGNSARLRGIVGKEIREMTRTQIFPSILIVLDCAAAITYTYTPDLRRAIYWLAAAVLTACVTF